MNRNFKTQEKDVKMRLRSSSEESDEDSQYEYL